MPEIPHQALVVWAAGKPTIKALYVFGSYARGDAKPDSDLDLAVEFSGVVEADAELITNRAAWKVELTRLTGITIRDIYHRDAKPVTDGVVVRVFSRVG